MARRARKLSTPVWQPDTTTPCNRHRLAGLEPDNLLAFMALLGLLRALEHQKPAWQPRAFWDVETQPWRPVLTLAQKATEAEVAQAAAEGARSLLSPVEEVCRVSAQLVRQRIDRQIRELEAEISSRKENDKDTKKIEKRKEELEKRREKPRPACKIADIAKTVEELTELHGTQDRLREVWVSCLAGWAQTGKSDIVAEGSPLKLTSGQQAFAGLFVTLANSAAEGEVARALFQPWRYLHRGDSFRLDRVEARRYAYLAGDPTDKTLWTVKGQTGTGVAPSERGANLLAAVGYLSFPVLTTRKGVAVPGLDEQATGRVRVPLWSSRNGRGATRAGIGRLLSLAGRDEPFRHPDVVGWEQFHIHEVSDNPTSKYKSAGCDGFISADDMRTRPPYD